MKRLYLIGSLRNQNIPLLSAALRQENYEVFDDWFAAGPEADDYWQAYETNRGRSYAEALAGRAACNVFRYDKANLDRADAAILLLPAGKSGHLELGYFIGTGKPGFIAIPDNPGRYDVMYNFATGVATDYATLVGLLRAHV